MILATIHVPLWLTAPVAIGLSVIVGFVWRRTGRFEHMRARDRMRRLGMISIMLLLVTGVLGLSVLDAGRHQMSYILIWSAATVLTLMVLFISLIDAMMTYRLETDHARQQLVRSTTQPECEQTEEGT